MISDVPHAIVESNEHHIKKLNIKIRYASTRAFSNVAGCRGAAGMSDGQWVLFM